MVTRSPCSTGVVLAQTLACLSLAMALHGCSKRGTVPEGQTGTAPIETVSAEASHLETLPSSDVDPATIVLAGSEAGSRDSNETIGSTEPSGPSAETNSRDGGTMESPDARLARELTDVVGSIDCPTGPGGGCDNCAPLGELIRERFSRRWGAMDAAIAAAVDQVVAAAPDVPCPRGPGGGCANCRPASELVGNRGPWFPEALNRLPGRGLGPEPPHTGLTLQVETGGHPASIRPPNVGGPPDSNANRGLHP